MGCLASKKTNCLNWLNKFTASTIDHTITFFTTELQLQDNVCRALVDEKEQWIIKQKDKKDHYYRAPGEKLQEVLNLLKDDKPPWRYIKKTNDFRFIDECAYLCLRVRYELPKQEREFMDRWLTDEGFYDTVN